ncbi:MAG: aminopeptidase P family protein [Deltaproteobacteria bacterium]|nr:aminopeptidase P family protein [Deltaproteobacteria bacterium]
MNLRLKKIQERLAIWKIDALLITTMENIRYLSGFTGSSGVIIITSEQAFFLTDSRYAEQSKNEVGRLKIKIYKKQIEDVACLINKLKPRAIGFEAKGLVYETYRRLKALIHGKRLIPVSEDIYRIRARKDAGELKLIKKAISLSSVGFNAAMNCIAPGALECDAAFDIEMAMKKNGAEGLSFDIIAASGKRAALPHGKASDKRIKRHEMIIVDLGAKYNGYYSDETCTFAVGKPDKEQRKVYQVVKDAHDKAIEAVRPGVKASYIDSAARCFIKRAGYGRYFSHGTGHGVGLAVHEWPNISPYNDDVVEEGMVFTIEPGIYIPGWGGVRIEDMVLVTKNGCEVLTEMSKELKQVSS